MVRNYSIKNRYVRGARPEVSEETVERLASYMLDMVPASTAAGDLGISRQTVGKYYDAMFAQLQGYAVQALGARAAQRMSVSFEEKVFPAIRRTFPRSGEKIVEVVSEFPRRLPDLGAAVFNDVLTKGYVLLYKHHRTQMSEDASVHREMGILLGPVRKPWRVARRVWLSNQMGRFIIASGTRHARRYRRKNDEWSKWVWVYVGILKAFEKIFIVGLSQVVSRSYWRGADYFEAQSRAHRGLSENAFKRAYVIAMLQYGTKEAAELASPKVLLDSLERFPLDFSAKRPT